MSSIRELKPAAYQNTIENLDGFGLSSGAAEKARTKFVQAKFIAAVDAVIHDDNKALAGASESLKQQLSDRDIATILDSIRPGLSSTVQQKLAQGVHKATSAASSAVELEQAFTNVKSLTAGGEANHAARQTLAAQNLTLTSVAYADGSRFYGSVSGDDIADIKFNAYEPNARRSFGSERPTMTCPIVKDSNFSGPFGVIDLSAFTVKNKDGRTVSLQDIIEDPARHINGWNGPEHSFFDSETDVAGRHSGRMQGPKAAVMDNLVPSADGHTDTVPTIYTYSKQKLILVAVPGEGISAHFSNGRDTIKLPINSDGKEKALRITRRQFSDKEGTTSFEKGASAVDDMLINSALIVQIPVRDPDAPPQRRLRGGFSGGAAVLESFGAAPQFLGATRSVSRGGAASLDAGNYGTEAGVVTAGGELGDQKRIPPRLERTSGVVRVDFVLYAATDSNIVSEALAKRMRADMDTIINHPACTKANREPGW